MLTVLTSILITVIYVYIGCGKCNYQTVRNDIVDHIVVTFQKLSWSNSKAAGLAIKCQEKFERILPSAP